MFQLFATLVCMKDSRGGWGSFAGITSPGEHSLVEGVKEASDRVLERAMRSWIKVNLQTLRRVVWFPEDDAALV